MPADNKKQAQLNCTHHLLSQLPYNEIAPLIALPERIRSEDYARRPVSSESCVP